MNVIIFSGRLAAAPDVHEHGETTVARFRLIRNEYAGKDSDGSAKERTVSAQFSAFNRKAEAIAKNAMVGDQLIVHASIRNNNFKDSEGRDRYEYSFEVEHFEFGAPGQAKREKLASSGS